MEGRITAAVLASTGIRPAEVVILEPGTLPRTSSGKLQRREALRRHLGGELTPPRRVTPALLLGAVARSSLAFRGLRRSGKGPADG